jgi:hypothetical protein
MRPKLIIGERQSGRTTELIKATAADEAHGHVSYIVCHSQEEAYRISQVAEKMELSIGFPLTYREFLDRQYSGKNIDKFYIDNLSMLLAYICPVSIEMVVW